MIDRFEIKEQINEALLNELESFIEIDEVKDEVFESFKGNDHKDVFNSVWGDVRDEWIDELNDRLFDVLDNMLIYYADQYAVINALQLVYDFNDDNDLGIEISNVGQLAFANLYSFTNDEGLIYDAVDNFLSSEFDVELN